MAEQVRDLATLPKAHLHLHFTGSMRPQTLVELAAKHGMALPRALTRDWPPALTEAADARGWFRFQRLYDAARLCVRSEADMRRIVAEAAADDAAEGSGWLELQIDPTSYAPYVGGSVAALDIVLDEAAAATRRTGTGVGIIVAASRIRHPLEARTLARLAARHAGDGPGTVVGFGLSNDERRGHTPDFAPAFAIARRAGLLLAPHGGELLGPVAVAQTLDMLAPQRLGHGVRSVEDPRVLQRVIDAGVALEVCPGSNVALGVYARPPDVPLRDLIAAGARVALGADDPLLFGSRLTEQYRSARHAHGLSDAELADLARSSVRASAAPEALRTRLLEGIDAWLAAPPDGQRPSSPTAPDPRTRAR